jgi:L-amino acid N-acyltransferase YncA
LIVKIEFVSPKLRILIMVAQTVPVKAAHKLQGAESSSIDIRDATMSDCADIVRIWREGCMNSFGFPAPPQDDAFHAFSSRLAAPASQSRIWVAIADGAVIGWQGLTLAGPTQILPVAQSSTYIDHNWQTKGVGSLLLTHAQNEAPHMGLWGIIGWIKADNTTSIKMVMSLGWVQMGPLPSSDKERPQYIYYAYAVPRRE